LGDKKYSLRPLAKYGYSLFTLGRNISAASLKYPVVLPIFGAFGKRCGRIIEAIPPMRAHRGSRRQGFDG
jgi:hypothetical protein